MIWQSEFRFVRELMLFAILATFSPICLYVSTGQQLFIHFTVGYKRVLPLLG